jgi:soluble lytic murein transglycosylase-like protein
MNPKLLLTKLALTAAVLALPATAHAQIYSWRDASGTLVISSSKPSDLAATETFAIAGTTSTGFRSTRYATGKKSQPYDSLIEQNADKHGISPDLVRAVIQAESAFNPIARSHKGAMGLMQLMPATAAELGVDNAYDPAQNIAGGTAYLKGLLVRYKGNEELALAAYNAGAGAVEKYGAVPPYKETRAYVAKIRGNSAPAASSKQVYRTVEIVNGREVARYSNVPSPSASVVHGAAVR